MKIEIEIPDKYAESIKDFEAKTGVSFVEHLQKSVETMIRLMPHFRLKERE